MIPKCRNNREIDLQFDLVTSVEAESVNGGLA